MSLLIASDIHVARFWDRLERALPKRLHTLNPNRMLRRLVKRVKKGDTLVLNGDLVDYDDAEYDRPGASSNWDFFFSIIKPVRGQTLLNLGNHDYRKLPYNVSLYGLRHVNLLRPLQSQYARKIGFNRFRGLREFGSISVPSDGPPKAYPFKRYYQAVSEEKELLFLETGPDSLSLLHNLLLPERWPMLFLKVSCRGLDKEQLQFLEKATRKESKRPLFIFTHAPPFFSVSPFETKLLSRNEHIKGWKLRHRVFYLGVRRFIDLLVSSKRNIVVVSGHTHVARQFLIDKERRTLHDSTLEEVNEHLHDPRYVKFLTTFPLGALRKPNTRIGYLQLDKQGFEYVVLEDFDKKKG